MLRGEDKMAEEEPEENKIIELIASVQRAGDERGKRIYFDSKSIEEISERVGWRRCWVVERLRKEILVICVARDKKTESTL